MVESLASIMLDFPGEANRARCLAHIVNLVVKIILRQFDVSNRKKNANIPDVSDLPVGDENVAKITEDDVEELVRALDKEEKEMDEGDEGDDEENEKVVKDIEIIEATMEHEVKEVLEAVKPVRQVLFKVGTSIAFK
jgi:hypothetical protein